jgi:Retinoblastoma-associated protein B domain
MCAIYGVCKVQPGLQIQFNHIINKYSEMFKNQRSIIHVYMQVPCANNEKKDIINFYNDIYIKSMKDYIISMKPGSNQNGAGGPG